MVNNLLIILRNRLFFKVKLSEKSICGGGTAATAVACRATFRGFESHPPLKNGTKKGCRKCEKF